MNIKKLIREEFNKYNKQLKHINEANVVGKTIVNVDIQEEYSSYIKSSMSLSDWVNFINDSAENNRIVFLFNGPELGYKDENEYKHWLFELGIEEDVLMHAIFYDKGYAFFRNCMDQEIDHDAIVALIQYMIENNINDSRDIDEEMWNDFTEQVDVDSDDLRSLENSDNMITIPDLMDFLKNLSNIVLTGGGVEECLKEVEIALIALNKDYNILNEYTF